jgi:hypothetical protein
VVPLVVGPSGIPVVIDPERAIRAPEVGVLSAMAHGRRDVETAVNGRCSAHSGSPTWGFCIAHAETG